MSARHAVFFWALALMPWSAALAGAQAPSACPSSARARELKNDLARALAALNRASTGYLVNAQACAGGVRRAGCRPAGAEVLNAAMARVSALTGEQAEQERLLADENARGLCGPRGAARPPAKSTTVRSAQEIAAARGQIDAAGARYTNIAQPAGAAGASAASSAQTAPAAGAAGPPVDAPTAAQARALRQAHANALAATEAAMEAWKAGGYVGPPPPGSPAATGGQTFIPQDQIDAWVALHGPARLPPSTHYRTGSSGGVGLIEIGSPADFADRRAYTGAQIHAADPAQDAIVAEAWHKARGDYQDPQGQWHPGEDGPDPRAAALAAWGVTDD